MASQQFLSLKVQIMKSIVLRFALALLLVGSFMSCGPLVHGQRIRENQSTQRPEPLRYYMGREIAQPMSYLGADWLVRATREREERCSMVLANLGLKPNMTVCDMGCGNGFYAIPIAKLLGESGRVLAVDIQPEMLVLLRDRMESENVQNITPILGSVDEPRLPENSVDLFLMVDVYHEFSYPEQMLAAIHRALKPDGLIVLVEFRAEDDKVPIKPEHKMSREQIEKEMTANGFQFAKSFDRLPWQHMVFYGKRSEE